MENYDESPSLDNDGFAGGQPLPSAARHDGFTPKRRRKFLRTLAKTGCVRDACRRAEISDSAAYKARRRDAEFSALWDTALSKAGSDLEILAWQRAVEGVEEDVIAYGKVIGTRRKRDANLFRMLLQASNPDRYGGQGFGSRKMLEKKIRKQIAAEQEPEIHHEDIEEVRQRILRKLKAFRQRRIDAGEIYEIESGECIPVGYVKASDVAQAAPPPTLAEDETGPNEAETGVSSPFPEPPSDAVDDTRNWRESPNTDLPGSRGPWIRQL
jgi:hypothetical protein